MKSILLCLLCLFFPLTVHAGNSEDLEHLIQSLHNPSNDVKEAVAKDMIPYGKDAIEALIAQLYKTGDVRTQKLDASWINPEYIGDTMSFVLKGSDESVKARVFQELFAYDPYWQGAVGNALWRAVYGAFSMDQIIEHLFPLLANTKIYSSVLSKMEELIKGVISNDERFDRIDAILTVFNKHKDALIADVDLAVIQQLLLDEKAINTLPLAEVDYQHSHRQYETAEGKFFCLVVPRLDYAVYNIPQSSGFEKVLDHKILDNKDYFKYKAEKKGNYVINVLHQGGVRDKNDQVPVYILDITVH